jgi:hypothetical protein
MTKDSIALINGHEYKYRYNKETKEMDYLGPVGDAPSLSQSVFHRAVSALEARAKIIKEFEEAVEARRGGGMDTGRSRPEHFLEPFKKNVFQKASFEDDWTDKSNGGNIAFVRLPKRISEDDGFLHTFYIPPDGDTTWQGGIAIIRTAKIIDWDTLEEGFFSKGDLSPIDAVRRGIIELNQEYVVMPTQLNTEELDVDNFSDSWWKFDNIQDAREFAESIVNVV